jgi:peptidoglycan/LPS O-acetylase OafA/YrhL
MSSFNSPGGSHLKWVGGLDSLRFVLAMVVFLGHLENSYALFFKSSANVLVKWFGIGLNHVFFGPGAVVGFFIISGFVIHYPVKNRALDVTEFLLRRWLRIGLPLIIVVLISLYFDRFYYIPIWSLYCELIYYTIYPLLRKTRISWLVQYIIAFAIAIFTAVVLAQDELASLFSSRNINYTGSFAALGDLLTWIVGLPCWLLGVLLAEHIDSLSNHVTRFKIYLTRLFVIGIGICVVGLKAHLFVSFIFTLNFFALILYYWISLEIQFFRTHKPSPILEYAGKFSYSLYLLHGLLVSFMVVAIEVDIKTYFVFVFFTLLASWVFYLAVEEPSHRLSKIIAKEVRFTARAKATVAESKGQANNGSQGGSTPFS